MPPDQLKQLHTIFANLTELHTFTKPQVSYLIKLSKLTDEELYAETLKEHSANAVYWHMHALHHEWQSRLVL